MRREYESPLGGESIKVRLLLITQTVDTTSDILGFFQGWLEKLAEKCESITVICLTEGDHRLPANVCIRSLGKRHGLSRARLLCRFYKQAWGERAHYDSVFVHMTPIYVLLGWPLWQITGKPIFLWYNHSVGTPVTRLAIELANIVFYTSPFSFAAKCAKALIMPAGIPTKLFQRRNDARKGSRTILYLGRLSPAKRIDCLIDAANLLDRRTVHFQLRVVGSPARSGDQAYEKELHQRARALIDKGKVAFHAPVRNLDTPEIYNQSQILVNLSAAGSLDKTILEAMACETLVLVSSRAFDTVLPNELKFKESNAEDLADKIVAILGMEHDKQEGYRRQLRQYVEEYHDLDRLMEKLTDAMMSHTTSKR